MILKDFIKECEEIGECVYFLHEGNLFRVYYRDKMIDGKYKTSIQIEKGANNPYLCEKDSDFLISPEEDIIPCICLLYDSYYHPLISYRYDTKMVIWEFNKWLI